MFEKITSAMGQIYANMDSSSFPEARFQEQKIVFSRPLILSQRGKPVKKKSYPGIGIMISR
jgi:hypothetical protein